jgi:hypothetical protein
VKSAQGVQDAGVHRVAFGSEQIECHVLFTNGQRLKISVHPDLRVTVRAPAGRALEGVLAEVRKRGRWIMRQKEFFGQFLPRMPEKQYVSGETFCYLGRQYRLKVVEGRPKKVSLSGRFIWVRTPDRNDRDAVRALVQEWYTAHARATFERRLDRCHEQAKRYEISRPAVRLRRMARRWGSCNGRSTILLNTELVKAPVHCIAYVVMHELCHTKFPKHDERFYRVLSRLMPDWEARKARLEQVVI